MLHGPLTGNTMEKWPQFKQIVIDSAKSTLGLKKRAHQDWFDENNEEICKALDKKNKAYQEWQNDPSSVSDKDCT